MANDIDVGVCAKCKDHAEFERTDEGERVSNCCGADEYDPTPYCAGCGAMARAKCDCGPIADNE